MCIYFSSLLSGTAMMQQAKCISFTPTCHLTMLVKSFLSCKEILPLLRVDMQRANYAVLLNSMLNFRCYLGWTLYHSPLGYRYVTDEDDMFDMLNSVQWTDYFCNIDKIKICVSYVHTKRCLLPSNQSTMTKFQMLLHRAKNIIPNKTTACSLFHSKQAKYDMLITES